MKNLLIVYHSQSGGTMRMAEAVHEGCQREEDVETRFITAFDADLSDLRWADGILFGTPENFGYMSGAWKDFFDRTFYPAAPFQLNLHYGIFAIPAHDCTII